MEFKQNKNEFIEPESGWWAPGAEGGGKQGDVGQRALTFCYEMNKF